MDPQADALVSDDAPTSTATNQATTAATVQPGTAVLSMPDGTTLTVPTGALTVLELVRALAPVTNHIHNHNNTVDVASGAVYNATTTTVQAGGTVNNAERQTMYTGGGAPNGTGGPLNGVPAAIARIESLLEDIKGQIKEILDTSRKNPRTDYGSPQPMGKPAANASA